ncbi:hypothetical protein [Tissierella sp.]|uniref:hypothetical protein n=1 Tax=Tissierella sp. TaxID=41274 RepID=UPI0028AE8496|nr:hypothetical protein [Tissierella sp.]
MGMFLFMIGFLGGIASIVMLIFNAIKKKPKKKTLISIGLCFVLFVSGASIIGSSSKSTQSKVDEAIEKVEDEEKTTIKEELKLTDEEKELLSKSYNDLDSKGRTVFAEILEKFDDILEEEQEQFNSDVDRMKVEKEEWIQEQEKIREENAKKPENRKKDIEKAIKNRVEDGDYKNAKLDKITINEDLGSEEDGLYIALVYFTFDIRNKKETGNELMRMYSDDLVATLADKGIEDISEAAIFWVDDYNNRNLKYAYGYKDGGFYIMDIAE